MTTETPEMNAQELAVSVEQLPGSTVRLVITVPEHDVDHAIDHAVRHISQSVKIPGFRPGKAPSAVVERAVGWPAIQQESVDHLLNDVFRRIVDEHDLHPVADPTVEKVGTLERHHGIELTISVAVRPTVNIAGYAKIRVKSEDGEVKDEDVDARLLEVRERYAELKEISGKAEAGMVVIAKAVMRKGEEVVAGSETETQELLLDRERLIDGMVDGIVGMVAGESRTFELTLPDTFPTEELRNVSVHTTVTVDAVKERILPELTDELAEKDGHGPTVEDLTSHYRLQLEVTAQRQAEEKFEQSVVDALDDAVTVDIPPVMVDLELDQWAYETSLRFAQLGLTFDKYLEYTNETFDQWKASRKDEAAKRVRIRLALDEVAIQEGVEIDESTLASEVAAIVGTRKVKADERARIETSTRRQLLRQGALTRMIEIARGEE